MAAIIKTVLVLALFVIMSAACFSNIKRHRIENKEAEEKRKRENFPNAKKLKPRDKGAGETMIEESSTIENSFEK